MKEKPTTADAPAEINAWQHLKWALLSLCGTLVIWRVAPWILELLGLDKVKAG